MISENYKSHETISTRQMVILMFSVSIPFKVAMLPSYMAHMSPQGLPIAIALLMAVECLTALFTAHAAKCGGIMEAYRKADGARKVFVGAIIALVCLLCAIKLYIYFGEFVTYAATELFDDIPIGFVVVTLLPVVVYLASKPAYVLGRTSDMCLLLILVTAAFSICFNTIQFDRYAVLPIVTGGTAKLTTAAFCGAFWIGDTLPIAFMKLQNSRQDTKYRSVYFTVIALFLLIVGYYLLLVFTYGRVLEQVPNTFSRIAIFNKVSEELGAIEWPIIITWLVMALCNFGALSYAILQPFTHVKKGKKVVYVAFILFYCIIMLTVYHNIDYELNTLIKTPLGFLGLAAVPLAIMCAVFCARGRNEEHIS